MKRQPIPIALHNAVMQCLREKLQQANLMLQQNWPEPTVNYRLTGTSAGTAWPRQWEIRLNPVLLLENQQAFIQQVIPHELAHLLVDRHFGRVPPHGKAWRWMMEEVLHVPAKRTHAFATQSVQGRSYAYQCDCQHHQLTIRRHNRAQQGNVQYHCKACRGVLRFLA